MIGKAEAEAYEQIEMVPKGRGAVAYGVMYHWFTDVSGGASSEIDAPGPAEERRRIGRACADVAG